MMRTLTKWSVKDYQNMRALGVLDHHRCELINGEIWDMAPEGESHRFINDLGAEYLRRILQDKVKVFEAHPITLPESEPEPDIAIVHLPNTRYIAHHPYPEDIYWLIEVAESTLTFDLTTKRQLYGRAGIQEYWVIDISGRQLTVFRDLTAGDYSTQITVREGVIHPITFPEVAITVSKLVTIPEC